MGMTGASKKTGHSISRCPGPMQLQYSQQYLSQWTSSCPILRQMVQLCVFAFFLESRMSCGMERIRLTG